VTSVNPFKDGESHYHQRMAFLARIATAVDRVVTAIVDPLLRGATALLTAVLRRGRHRDWRRRETGARRTDTTGS
jgi:hypothetical protein